MFAFSAYMLSTHPKFIAIKEGVTKAPDVIVRFVNAIDDLADENARLAKRVSSDIADEITTNTRRISTDPIWTGAKRAPTRAALSGVARAAGPLGFLIPSTANSECASTPKCLRERPTEKVPDQKQ